MELDEWRCANKTCKKLLMRGGVVKCPNCDRMNHLPPKPIIERLKKIFHLENK